MREWNKAAFDAALEAAERMEGVPFDARTIQWMRWAYLQAWLSPLGHQYEVRRDDATIGPVSWDQLLRARTENKIPAGSQARIVGPWTSVADLVAGRSLDLGDYESSRSFFEEADGSDQLVQRMVSALMQLPQADEALRAKIEGDVRSRGWERHVTSFDHLAPSLRDCLAGAVADAKHSGCSFGDHQFHCLRRGSLALALRFERVYGEPATVMMYAFRSADQFVIVTSAAI